MSAEGATRYVCLKQSGERLTDDGGEIWTPNGVRASAEKLRALSRKAPDLNISGLVIVSGAGNIIRGKKLEDQGIGGEHADVLGRLATVQNTLVLASALGERDVPHKVFLSANMKIGDPVLGELEPWSEETAHDAMQHGKVVLIAGGTGENGVTTDNAVVTYAASLGSYFSELGDDSSIEILKGTKLDGVYDGDPTKVTGARRYSTISARTMIDDYERYCAVDLSSLHQLEQYGMNMRVFADADHDLVHTLHPKTIANGTSVGTLISGLPVEDVFAD